MTYTDAEIHEIHAIARAVRSTRCVWALSIAAMRLCGELRHCHDGNALWHPFTPPEPATCLCGSPTWYHGPHTGVKGIISRKDLTDV